jgi:hypothetical protein
MTHPDEHLRGFSAGSMQGAELPDDVPLAVGDGVVGDGVLEAQHAGGDALTDQVPDPPRVVLAGTRRVQRRAETDGEGPPLRRGIEGLRQVEEQLLGLLGRQEAEMTHLGFLSSAHQHSLALER